MDPLCHTLVGGALAGTRLGERTWGAAATLLVAANLPDVDVLSYALGGDFALGARRGWTHGLPAQALLPLLLAVAVVAWGRWRGARGLRPAQVVLLAYVGLLTHPLLDWLNVYGMRWLMPFDDRWYYGDTLFIVDPWLWLLLGGGVFLRFSTGRRALAGWAALALAASAGVLTAPVPVAAKALWLAGLGTLAAVRAARGPLPPRIGRRWSGAALAAAALFAIGLGLLGLAARAGVAAELARAGGEPPRQIYTAPLPAQPAGWDVLLVYADRYRPGRWGYGTGLELEPAIAAGGDDPRIAAALTAPCVQGMRTWMRYPFYRVVDEAGGGTTVHILDARYARSPGGFGTASVYLDAAGRVTGCG